MVNAQRDSGTRVGRKTPPSGCTGRAVFCCICTGRQVHKGTSGPHTSHGPNRSFKSLQVVQLSGGLCRRLFPEVAGLVCRGIEMSREQEESNGRELDRSHANVHGPSANGAELRNGNDEEPTPELTFGREQLACLSASLGIDMALWVCVAVKEMFGVNQRSREWSGLELDELHDATERRMHSIEMDAVKPASNSELNLCGGLKQRVRRRKLVD